MTDPIEQQLRKEAEEVLNLYTRAIQRHYGGTVAGKVLGFNEASDRLANIFDTYAARRAGLGASEKLALLDRVEKEVLNVGGHGLISLREEQHKALAKLRAEQKETDGMSASDRQHAENKPVNKQVDKLDLVVVWPEFTQDGEMPSAYYKGEKAGIYQTIELLTNKINEVIALTNLERKNRHVT